ncbi:type II toxin-antitoxin system HicB family antitoxin [Alicyclobacillus ferrooxydans]|uniref:HicB n=1 Tax=Alicyclobacillus ferrooxydans TaxID=471514 RepID=A0A0P9GT58_9BACL|nr:type II toxin-antitoxin system HicB family antitoxin [Alicyclobacillus ferrooxydans]KPV44300.1 HicB [Alicyclobacillus ferrooxydans]
MMNYKGYLARVEFDDEVNIFHGEVINTRDVITFQGVSVDELRCAFEESVEDYLAFCVERGEEPEQPYSGKFMVRLSPDQHRLAVLAAKKSGKSLNAWVAEQIGREAKNELGLDGNTSSAF